MNLHNFYNLHGGFKRVDPQIQIIYFNNINLSANPNSITNTSHEFLQGV